MRNYSFRPTHTHARPPAVLLLGFRFSVSNREPGSANPECASIKQGSTQSPYANRTFRGTAAVWHPFSARCRA
jgi:hypothetical protein